MVIMLIALVFVVMKYRVVEMLDRRHVSGNRFTQVLFFIASPPR